MFWDTAKSFVAPIQQFKLLEFMTDKGQKESIVALNSCGDIFFSSHFTVQIPKKIDDGFA